ncbi:IS3 family transposase [Bacillus cereus]|uniref:IS3 family transposase n=1 Tax=Bacillus cereus TaxID=1396 RepID=UPI0002790A9B|nr:hypothetical protein IC3_02300 [Bacillus cereus VD142]
MLVFIGGREGANPGDKEIDEWLHKKNFPVVINEIKSTKQFKGLDLLIEINENKDYMKYYNQHRYQWNVKKMTSVEYRSHLLTAT